MNQGMGVGKIVGGGGWGGGGAGSWLNFPL